ncbi:uncharacterized protein LOC136039897 [Artemia franciscana]|uniref:uncharacterized protein LOC136039897 n=1 Tax=Artemia franciscana TaxID=6661 RepID=UPI0032DB5DCF
MRLKTTQLYVLFLGVSIHGQNLSEERKGRSRIVPPLARYTERTDEQDIESLLPRRTFEGSGKTNSLDRRKHKDSSSSPGQNIQMLRINLQDIQRDFTIPFGSTKFNFVDSVKEEINTTNGAEEDEEEEILSSEYNSDGQTKTKAIPLKLDSEIIKNTIDMDISDFISETGPSYVMSPNHVKRIDHITDLRLTNMDRMDLNKHQRQNSLIIPPNFFGIAMNALRGRRPGANHLRNRPNLGRRPLKNQFGPHGHNIRPGRQRRPFNPLQMDTMNDNLGKENAQGNQLTNGDGGGPNIEPPRGNGILQSTLIPIGNLPTETIPDKNFVPRPERENIAKPITLDSSSVNGFDVGNKKEQREKPTVINDFHENIFIGTDRPKKNHFALNTLSNHRPRLSMQDLRLRNLSNHNKFQEPSSSSGKGGRFNRRPKQPLRNGPINFLAHSQRNKIPNMVASDTPFNDGQYIPDKMQQSVVSGETYLRPNAGTAVIKHQYVNVNALGQESTSSPGNFDPNGAPNLNYWQTLNKENLNTDGSKSIGRDKTAEKNGYDSNQNFYRLQQQKYPNDLQNVAINEPIDNGETDNDNKQAIRNFEDNFKSSFTSFDFGFPDFIADAFYNPFTSLMPDKRDQSDETGLEIHPNNSKYIINTVKNSKYYKKDQDNAINKPSSAQHFALQYPAFDGLIQNPNEFKGHTQGYGQHTLRHNWKNAQTKQQRYSVFENQDDWNLKGRQIESDGNKHLPNYYQLQENDLSNQGGSTFFPNALTGNAQIESGYETSSKWANLKIPASSLQPNLVSETKPTSSDYLTLRGSNEVFDGRLSQNHPSLSSYIGTVLHLSPIDTNQYVDHSHGVAIGPQDNPEFPSLSLFSNPNLSNIGNTNQSLEQSFLLQGQNLEQQNDIQAKNRNEIPRRNMDGYSTGIHLSTEENPSRREQSYRHKHNGESHSTVDNIAQANSDNENGFTGAPKFPSIDDFFDLLDTDMNNSRSKRKGREYKSLEREDFFQRMTSTDSFESSATKFDLPVK